MTSVKLEISWPRGTNRKLGHCRKRVAIPVVDRIMRVIIETKLTEVDPLNPRNAI